MVTKNAVRLISSRTLGAFATSVALFTVLMLTLGHAAAWAEEVKKLSIFDAYQTALEARASR